MSTLRTLPGDDVRQIMWRYSERFDIQMAVQSARSIARGLVARLVADGERNNHDWTDAKAQLLTAFDQSGLTAIFLEPEEGGFIAGPKNLALALIAFELAWVDGGAATCSLANNLALAPIHERGTEEQVAEFKKRCTPPQPGEDREISRGAFALTEPLPYVGVDTGVLNGKIRVEEWKDGEEPVLKVDKRGRFITNMPFCDFVTAAVDTDDERIKTSCMVILDKKDEGLFDPGATTLKMCHQLSATSDPVLSLKVPANRIIGGYTIQDGVIVPNYSHTEIIAAVFHRTRITVGLMTSAKLLSAVEPIIRYHRSRFRGGDSSTPGTPKAELGIQQKEDALHRLLDVWATGEAGASFGYEASRLADEFDVIEKQKECAFEAENVCGARKQMMALRKMKDDVLEYIDLMYTPEAERDQARFDELGADCRVRYLFLECQAGILNPGCKLWNTGQGANMLRESVALIGGYGITEDAPGFLMHKWADSQLEATYEGPEAVQRRHLTATMTNDIFQHLLTRWIEELKRISAENSETSQAACLLAAGMELWLWSMKHLQTAKDANGKKLYNNKRQGVTFPMADALCWLLPVRYLLLDVRELLEKGPQNPMLAEGMDGLADFYPALAHTQAARAVGEAGRICAELVYGYLAHADCSSCCASPEIPADLSEFAALRQKVDLLLAGSRLAKDRASEHLKEVMIPEALDYPI